MPTATAADLLTLPEASIRLGIHLDRLRRAARTPAVAALLTTVGPVRTVKACDLERLRELLTRPRVRG